MTNNRSDLKPWQAVLILVFFLTLLFVILELQSRKNQYTGASYIHYSDRQLNILLGNQILRFHEDGRYSQIDLQRMGLSDVTGAFDFFDNGDLLIRSNAPRLGFIDSILVFLRVSGRVTATHPEAVLLRCSLGDASISNCTVFEKDIAFERTFRPAFTGDQLLIADTSRHRLLHFGPDGQLQKALEEGFVFPNQISVINDTIYVANTDRHRISYRQIEDERVLGELRDWQHIGLRQGVAQTHKHIFPTEFVKLEKGLAVLSQGPGLKLGNIYYINQEGLLESAFNAPAAADIISIAPYKNEILAADFSNFRIYRFSTQGHYLGDFNAPEYLSAITERQSMRQRYESYLWAVYIIGALVFVFFVAIGLWLEWVRQRRDKTALVHEQTQFSTIDHAKPGFDDPAIEWLPYAPDLIRDNKVIVWLLNGVLLLLWLMLIYFSWSVAHMYRWAIVLTATVFLCILAWGLFRKKQRRRARLGVLGQWVLIEDAKGRRAICRIDQLKYTKAHLIADEVYIQLMEGNQPVFKSEAYRDIIEPRLGRAEKLSQLELWRFLWRKKDRNFIAAAVSVPLILLFIFARFYFDF